MYWFDLQLRAEYLHETDVHFEVSPDALEI